MFPFLHLFDYNIPMYGICIMVGLAVAFLAVQWRCKPMGLRRDDSLYCCLLASIGLILGGKLLYIITVLPEIISHWNTFWTWENIYAIFAGGYVFYGGLFGALMMVFWFTKHYHISTLRMFDCLVVAVPIAHCIGRMGCFCAGCCYGIPVSWGLYFNASPVAPHDVALLPIQLIEAGCNLLLFCVLLILSFRPHKKGWLTGLYLLCYAVMRFVLEFFRYDAERGRLLWFSTSQWISLLIVFAAMWLIICNKEKNKPKKKT